MYFYFIYNMGDITLMTVCLKKKNSTLTDKTKLQGAKSIWRLTARSGSGGAIPHTQEVQAWCPTPTTNGDKGWVISGGQWRCHSYGRDRRGVRNRSLGGGDRSQGGGDRSQGGRDRSLGGRDKSLGRGGGKKSRLEGSGRPGDRPGCNRSRVLHSDIPLHI